MEDLDILIDDGFMYSDKYWNFAFRIINTNEISQSISFTNGELVEMSVDDAESYTTIQLFQGVYTWIVEKYFIPKFKYSHSYRSIEYILSCSVEKLKNEFRKWLIDFAYSSKIMTRLDFAKLLKDGYTKFVISSKEIDFIDSFDFGGDGKTFVIETSPGYIKFYLLFFKYCENEYFVKSLDLPILNVIVENEQRNEVSFIFDNLTNLKKFKTILRLDDHPVLLFNPSNLQARNLSMDFCDSRISFDLV